MRDDPGCSRDTSAPLAVARMIKSRARKASLRNQPSKEKSVSFFQNDSMS